MFNKNINNANAIVNNAMNSETINKLRSSVTDVIKDLCFDAYILGDPSKVKYDLHQLLPDIGLQNQKMLLKDFKQHPTNILGENISHKNDQFFIDLTNIARTLYR